jgi:hypothetical protein
MTILRWAPAPSTVLLLFALATTGLTIITQFVLSGPSPPLPSGSNSLPVPGQLLDTLRWFSTLAAPISWTGVISLWMWRGRVRSKWKELGFDRDVFQLMTRMRGAATRLAVLEALVTPADRLQLAKKLGLDWKAIDNQVSILLRYNLICEKEAFGKVRIYSVSENGKKLLRLMKKIDTSRVDTLQLGSTAGS